MKLTFIGINFPSDDASENEVREAFNVADDEEFSIKRVEGEKQ